MVVEVEKSSGETVAVETTKNKDDLLPVSLLCGFLGAGKTTLLKHVLETKHIEEGFKCAVIVNDMAALNIDKSLIDQSALVQSDEVIAMQNGCFCCTLQNDLVEQITTLSEKKIFNYMLIEASGVSEPAQIAPLFDLCDDEHDHEAEHKEGPQLGEVARLDTCVTVIDAAEFYNNLDSMKVYEEGDMEGTISELLMEQVEYSNVVILNKQDLVSEQQQADIMDRIALLNPKAKVLKSCQSKIDVTEILNTGLFKATDMDNDSVMCAAARVQPKLQEEEELIECCIKSIEAGRKKCCKSKKNKLVDTGKSQVLLGVVENIEGQKQLTRHEKRFGITSFVYRARRPFHPSRLMELFLDPFFILRYDEREEELEKLQKRAAEKQKFRVKKMGELLRSKGFLWAASSHSFMGGFQQAGNIARIEAEGPWMVDVPDLWKGTDEEETVLKDMNKENGEEYTYGDRRQELVFIGMSLKYGEIQKVLDQCLLDDDEMQMGPDEWRETMTDGVKFALILDEDGDDDEDSDDEEGDDEDDEEDEEDEKVEEDDENDEDEELETKAKKRKI